MKTLRKLLFLALSVALIVCAFAIVSSADDDPVYVAKTLKDDGSDDQSFTDMYDAVNGILYTDGKQLVVLEDCELNVSAPKNSMTFQTAGAKTNVIDLNGHTVTITGDKSFFQIYKGTNLTICNGTLVLNNNCNFLQFGTGDNLATGKVQLGAPKKPLHLVEGPSFSGGQEVYVDDGVKVTLEFNNCTLDKHVATAKQFLYVKAAPDFKLVIKDSVLKLTNYRYSGMFQFAGNYIDVYAENSKLYFLGNRKASPFYAGGATSADEGLTFKKCYIEWSYRFFNNDNNDGKAVTTFDECELVPLPNLENSEGTMLGRGTPHVLKDCKLKTDYLTDGMTSHSTTVTIKGDLYTNSGKQYTNAAKFKYPDGKYNTYYLTALATTNYPYVTTTKTFSVGEYAYVTAILNLSMDNITIGAPQAVEHGGTSGVPGVNIYNKRINKDPAGDPYTVSTIETTLNGTNKYYKWAMNIACNQDNNNDPYMDFLVANSGNASGWPASVPYVTLDFDIANESAYSAGFFCQTLLRKKGGSWGTGVNLFWINKETEGKHIDENYFKTPSGKKAYVGKDAFEWHHFTCLVYLETFAEVDADNYHPIKSLTVHYYLDGELFDSKKENYALGNDYLYLEQFRFAASANSAIGNVGDNIILDNVKIMGYNNAPATDTTYVNPMAKFFGETALTNLFDAEYPNYNKDYVMPERMPVAKIGDVYYQTLGDALAAEVAGQKVIDLVRDTHEEIAITEDVIIRTNGIEFAPYSGKAVPGVDDYDGSWGFTREVDAQNEQNIIYTFTEDLAAPFTLQWYDNPFDPEYYVASYLTAGQTIALIGDVTIVHEYVYQDEDGIIHLMTFDGWSEDEETVTEFRTLTGDDLALPDIYLTAWYTDTVIEPAYAVWGKIAHKAFVPETTEVFDGSYDVIVAYGDTIEELVADKAEMKDGETLELFATELIVPALKQNVSLETQFSARLYFPIYKGVTANIVINGVEVEFAAAENLDDYYVAFYAVEAGAAADKIEYKVTYTLDELELAVVEGATSVAAYAKALTTAFDGEYAELANGMLNYAKAAFVLANPEAAVPAIYDGIEAPEAVMADVANTMENASVFVTGASIKLGSKPSFVFLVADDFQGQISVTYEDIFGKEQTIVRDVVEGVTAYEFDLYVYNFAQTLTVKATPNEGKILFGEYNLAAYAAEATEASDFVAALNAYAKVAADYMIAKEAE